MASHSQYRENRDFLRFMSINMIIIKTFDTFLSASGLQEHPAGAGLQPDGLNQLVGLRFLCDVRKVLTLLQHFFCTFFYYYYFSILYLQIDSKWCKTYDL